MTLNQAISLGVQLSMALIVFCIALRASFDDVLSLLERPGLFVRSLLAMNVIMPVIAVAIAVAFELQPALEVALVAMALSPIPPIVPGKELKAGGSRSYVIGLVSASALVSIVFVPLVATLLGRAFGRPVQVSIGTIAWIVATSILLPIVGGVLVRRLAPGAAARLAHPLSAVATVLLVVAFVPVLFAERHALTALFGNFTFLAVTAFVLTGFAVGHLLGGPDPDNRTVLALSTSTRHPGVAMAIPNTAQDPKTVLAAILLVLLVGAVLSIPYVKWRKRVHASAPVRRLKGGA
jgi:BASS family bile acid:Na+ symporter